MLQNETQASVYEYTILRRGKSEMPDMLDLWIKIQKDIPTDSVVTFKILKDREGGYKPNEMIIFAGNNFAKSWFDETCNLRIIDEMIDMKEIEVPKKKNLQHGPIQKGKKGKLKRW